MPQVELRERSKDYSLRVTYRNGGENRGYYKTKKELLNALVIFLEIK